MAIKLYYNKTTYQLIGIDDNSESLVVGDDGGKELQFYFGTGASVGAFVNDATIPLNYLGRAVFKRADDESSNEIYLTPVLGTGGGYFKLILTGWFTDVEGNLEITTRLKVSDGDGGYVVDAFSVATLPIEPGVAPTDDTITDAQYNEIMDAVDGIIQGVTDIVYDDTTVRERLDEISEGTFEFPQLILTDGVGTTVLTKEYVDGEKTRVDDLEIFKDTTVPATYETKADATTHKGRTTALETANMIKSVARTGTDLITITKYDNTTLAVITLAEFRTWLGVATTSVSGLMSATDKTRLDGLYQILNDTTDGGADSLVDTIEDVLAIFEAYPEGVDLVTALAGKVNTSDIVNDLTTGGTTKVLSAEQGKTLQTNKADKFRTAQFERVKIESDTAVHSSGYRYTSFGGGVTFAGKELYAQHSASGHVTTTDPATWGVIVLYTRQENGNFTSQVLDLDYATLDGGVRDVNLSVSPNGKYLYLKFFTNAGVVGQYGAYLCVYNTSMTLVKRIQMFTGIDKVVWGNTLQSPDGYILTTAYRALNATKALEIYRSTAPVVDDFSSVTFSSVATISNGQYLTEATIAYWNNKLVLFTRVEANNSLYAETSDLNGVVGWSPLVSASQQLHAPAFPQYITEPYLVVSGSLRFSETLRKIAVMVRDLNGNWSAPSVLDNDMVAYSGYNSFVKNRYGYGVMYFEGAVEASGTNLYFKDVDIVRYLPQIQYLNATYNTNAEKVEDIGLDVQIADLGNKTLREVFERSISNVNGDFNYGFNNWTNVNNFNNFNTTDFISAPQSARQTNELQARYFDIVSADSDVWYISLYMKKVGSGTGAKTIVYNKNTFSNGSILTNNTASWVRSSFRGSKTGGIRVMIGHYGDNTVCDNLYDNVVAINQTAIGLASVSQATMDYWYNVYYMIKTTSTIKYILEKIKQLGA